jgi:Na+/H+ antiporter NhaD/arsenite permease-like protein
LPLFDKSVMSLVIFISAYVLFILKNDKRSYFAIIASIVLLIFGVMSPFEAFRAVNWNVMGIFVGTLVISEIFIESKVPAYLAGSIVNRSPNTTWAILSICMLTGLISAFVENVATVLIVAPIAIELAKKLKINPINMMIAIAIASNLQGCATLIGDPPSMLLAGYTKMTFMDFIFYHGKPSIFFAVELGAIASFAVLYWIFRKETEKVKTQPVEKPLSWVPSIMMGLLIILLALSSFIDRDFSYTAGVICMGFGAVSAIYRTFTSKVSIQNTVKGLDWDTTFFLMGVFVLVGSVTMTGWIEKIASSLCYVTGSNIFFGYTLLVFTAVIVSAVVDNVPFLAAMLPVAIIIGKNLGVAPQIFLFGLLIGASVGGNITPIGASANIVACGLLKKQGHSVSFGRFMSIGVPFTFAAVTASYLFIWFVWR